MGFGRPGRGGGGVNRDEKGEGGIERILELVGFEVEVLRVCVGGRGGDAVCDEEGGFWGFGCWDWGGLGMDTHIAIFR